MVEGAGGLHWRGCGSGGALVDWGLKLGGGLLKRGGMIVSFWLFPGCLWGLGAGWGG